tara:strand:- start:219 stop:659 length:441 start_codon:yes stop_codon:yes gene_type:complete
MSLRKINNFSSKHFLLVLLFFILFLHGCSKNNDIDGVNHIPPFLGSNRIAGDWELEKISFNGQSSSGNFDLTWTFERDGDFEQFLDYGSYSYAYAGNWEFDDNGEELEIVVMGSAVTYEINRLTSNELWLEQNYNGNVMEYEFEKN